MDRLYACFAQPSDATVDAVLQPLMARLHAECTGIDLFGRMMAEVEALADAEARARQKGMVLALLLGNPRPQDRRVAEVLGVALDSRDGLRLQIGLGQIREYCRGVGEDGEPNEAKIVNDVRQMLLIV